MSDAATKSHKATLIVATIVVVDGKILLVKEAKASCRGQYYLPAGRVEVGESIFAAATRECVEESGLEVMPTGILDVEHNVWGLMGDWMRFTMVGVLTGKGELKTKEDQESLGGEWVPLDKVKDLPLRGQDMLRLIEKWRQNFEKGAFIPLAGATKDHQAN